MRSNTRCAGYASRIARLGSPRTAAIISAVVALTILMTTVGEAAAQSDTPFITTWGTSMPGEMITFNLNGTGITVDWGDGQTATTDIVESVSHTYATAGNHTVQITGDLKRFYQGTADDASKLVSLDQWGTASWASMENAFRGAQNMVYNGTVSSGSILSHQHGRDVLRRQKLQQRHLRLERLVRDQHELPCSTTPPPSTGPSTPGTSRP